MNKLNERQDIGVEMKKKLRVYYADVPNMGDLLNKDIIKKCFGYDVVRNTYLTGEISGIGSGLGNYTYEDVQWKNVLKAMSSVVFPKVYIWGTGFVSYKDIDSKFYKRKTTICAVRGELSKKRVEKILGYKLNVSLADAGILASYLLEKMPEKKYDVGIIAHYKEQKDPCFARLLKRFSGSVFIDVRNSPYEVTKKIAECKVIISSSLHGLIIADSLGVPNRHIVVTDNLLGDGFKFDDYYSAYGLKHEFTVMSENDIVSLDDVVKEYKIRKDMVEEKKKAMIGCFPYPNIKE